MIRNIYLEGEMGEKFGTHFQFNAPTVRDAFKCLEANFPSFRRYIIECHEKSVGFVIDVADNTIDYIEECIMDLNVGDITITPIPAGSKSGVAKILAALAIAALFLIPGGAVFGVQLTSTAVGTGATTLTWAGSVVAGLSLNLAIMGLTQMMAPDPATDQDQEQSYLFNGAEKNTVQGDPVPVLYGQLRVPGQPISFEIAGINSSINTLGFGQNGSAYGITISAG